MKKMYIAPEVEINETMAASMMALSLFEKDAESEMPVLGQEENEWNIWASEEE